MNMPRLVVAARVLNVPSTCFLSVHKRSIGNRGMAANNVASKGASWPHRTLLVFDYCCMQMRKYSAPSVSPSESASSASSASSSSLRRGGISNVGPNLKEYHMQGFGSATKTFMARCFTEVDAVPKKASSATVSNISPAIIAPHVVNGAALAPIVTDVPRYMGGQDSAHQPIETFLAALCGCELVTAIYVANKMSPRIFIDKIEFDVRAVRDQRGSLSLPLGQPINSTSSYSDKYNNSDTGSNGTINGDGGSGGGGGGIPLSRLTRIWGTAVVHLREDAKTTTATGTNLDTGARGGNGGGSIAITQEEIDFLAKEIKQRCPIANMVVTSGCELDIQFVKFNQTNKS